MDKQLRGYGDKMLTRGQKMYFLLHRATICCELLDLERMSDTQLDALFTKVFRGTQTADPNAGSTDPQRNTE